MSQSTGKVVRLIHSSLRNTFYEPILTSAAEDRPPVEQIEGGFEYPATGAQIVGDLSAHGRDDIEMLTDSKAS